MAAAHRSVINNTFIYSSDDLNVLLGGLWVAEGITNANPFSMMEIFCIFSETFDLQYHCDPLVERDNSQLQPGDYFVVTNGRRQAVLVNLKGAGEFFFDTGSDCEED
ncbi:hypothetical protein B9Z19DRAFT_1163307 [Tuber borchii]|uniref:DUF7881 domain-containing protein n=1 Tax=Tuber borchii TaxID=42251 RepID=A0A2T6ZD20_TUBBO|nr:hypothetical protein B9Z19DRAFT_1163307 [Tuber borchii]